MINCTMKVTDLIRSFQPMIETNKYSREIYTLLDEENGLRPETLMD